MKAEKNRVSCIQLTVILLITTTLCVLISVDAKANPFCAQAIGKWKWDKFGTVVIRSDNSTLHEDTGNTGTWSCVDGKTVVIDWNVGNGVLDTLYFFDNGTRLKGQNNQKPPIPINATKYPEDAGANFFCAQAIGKWKWDKFGTVVIRSDNSTLHEDTGNTGTWSCVDGKTVVINWNVGNGVLDTLYFFDNGTRLKGQNNQKPPIPINATKYLGK